MSTEGCHSCPPLRGGSRVLTEIFSEDQIRVVKEIYEDFANNYGVSRIHLPSREGDPNPRPFLYGPQKVYDYMYFNIMMPLREMKHPCLNMIRRVKRTRRQKGNRLFRGQTEEFYEYNLFDHVSAKFNAPHAIRNEDVAQLSKQILDMIPAATTEANLQPRRITVEA